MKAGPEVVTVEPLGEGGGAEWDAFVDGAPGATACHRSGWRQIVSGVMGHEARYLVAREPEGRLVGVLPLARVRSRLFGDYLVSLPFLNDGGPLGSPEVRERLAAEAVGEARRAGVDLLELRTRTPLSGAVEAAVRKVTVLLDLPDTPGELWDDTLRAKVRSQIRRPMKEGMEVRFGAEERHAFYGVFARNMRDLGTPVLPEAFFEGLAAVLPELVRFGVVYHEGEPVAAGCGFAWKEEFEMTWASSLREHNRLAPNMLLYWAFMERSILEGRRVFNFGRCTPGGGTHRFKLQWGGHDLPLPWTRWAPGRTVATPSPTSRKFRMAVRAWQHLPLAAANRLGPLLSRNLP